LEIANKIDSGRKTKALLGNAAVGALVAGLAGALWFKSMTK